MARSVSEDFEHLVKFVHDYSLATLTSDTDYRANLKQGHREYLVLLSLWAAIDHELSKKKIIKIAGVDLAHGSLNYEQLKECVSDFGSAYFCCVHGIYKPGHMALRSNIENFVRSIAGLFAAKALTTTSIFELFDIAKTLPPFSGRGALFLAELRGAYRELCKFSHSASLTHMAHIGSLQHFPNFNNSAFVEWGKHAKKVMQNEISCLIYLSPNLYTHSHYKVKELLDLGFVDTELRRSILGG